MSDRNRVPHDGEDQAPTPLEKAIGDYLDLLNDGHSIDPDEVLARHPLFAHEILETPGKKIVDRYSPSSEYRLKALCARDVQTSVGLLASRASTQTPCAVWN